jgi:hypothetical protein
MEPTGISHPFVKNNRGGGDPLSYFTGHDSSYSRIHKKYLQKSTRDGGYVHFGALLPAAQPDGYGNDATRRGDEGDDDYDGVRAFYSGTNERAIERDRSTAVVALHFPLQRGKNRRGVGSRRIAVSSASRVRAIARERRKGT